MHIDIYYDKIKNKNKNKNKIIILCLFILCVVAALHSCPTVAICVKSVSSSSNRSETFATLPQWFTKIRTTLFEQSK